LFKGKICGLAAYVRNTQHFNSDKYGKVHTRVSIIQYIQWWNISNHYEAGLLVRVSADRQTVIQPLREIDRVTDTHRSRCHLIGPDLKVAQRGATVDG